MKSTTDVDSEHELKRKKGRKEGVAGTTGGGLSESLARRRKGRWTPHRLEGFAYLSGNRVGKRGIVTVKLKAGGEKGSGRIKGAILLRWVFRGEVFGRKKPEPYKDNISE